MGSEHWLLVNFGVCGLLAYGFLFAVKQVLTKTIPQLTAGMVSVFNAEREARLRMHNESRADRKEMEERLIKRLDSLHDDICSVIECIPKKWRERSSPPTKPAP